MDARFVQNEKASLPIILTVFGIVTLFKLVQLLKAYDEMTSTLSGIATDVNFSQERNAPYSIEVIVSGMSMKVN